MYILSGKYLIWGTFYLIWGPQFSPLVRHKLLVLVFIKKKKTRLYNWNMPMSEDRYLYWEVSEHWYKYIFIYYYCEMYPCVWQGIIWKSWCYKSWFTYHNHLCNRRTYTCFYSLKCHNILACLGFSKSHPFVLFSS